MNTLLPLLTDAYQYWLTHCDVGRDGLRALLHEMALLGAAQPSRSNVLPVVPQYLGQAAELATVPEFAALISTLLRVAPELDYRARRLCGG